MCLKQMLKKAIRSLLQQTDEDGTLIAVSRLNDSEKLKPLAVVLKCPGRWFWQKPKYKPTDFTLNDLLQGTSIEPVLEEKVFLNKYEERQKDSVSGTVEADMVGVSIKADGQGASRILSSVGTLLKERVILPHLLKDSRDRKVDLQHHLFRQTKGKNHTFTLVKERILTTSDCTINCSGLKKGNWTTSFKLISPVHLNKSICLQNIRDVVLEIPSHTVLAYSVSELKIKSDGCYEVGVSPDGIEVSDNITCYPAHNVTAIDGLWPLTTKASSLSAFSEELTCIRATLCELTCLTPETRFSLLNIFQEILPDQILLSTLEDQLERISEDTMYSHFSPGTSNELTDKFLDLLLSNINKHSTSVHMSCESTANTSHNGSSLKSTNQRQLILTAMHMLISAAEELTNSGLELLKTCSPETINGLSDVVTHLTSDSQQVPFSELPFLLRNGEVPQEVKLLFMSSNITLKIDNKELYAEIDSSDSNPLPLLLCIVIHGLAYLNESCEVDIEI
ncbi:Non-syndromic hearing impairment protein 5 [Bagarius yarrelli]|uniref:Non-syndromic hearing impairment protein 5 n=1 Tax=Bagarius yarrelli TaxID=175774 RepID=A0A556U8Q6_BAGYA|nr:Non-syndromic hearing impairment protein 5 [Bagarius yarrelli]